MNTFKKPPCKDCPYKLGKVKTLVNPCPQCKMNGYDFYRNLKKQAEKAFDNDED